jgi:hypothetical protein
LANPGGPGAHPTNAAQAVPRLPFRSGRPMRTVAALMMRAMLVP